MRTHSRDIGYWFIWSAGGCPRMKPPDHAPCQAGFPLLPASTHKNRLRLVARDGFSCARPDRFPPPRQKLRSTRCKAFRRNGFLFLGSRRQTVEFAIILIKAFRAGFLFCGQGQSLEIKKNRFTRSIRHISFQSVTTPLAKVVCLIGAPISCILRSFLIKEPLYRAWQAA